MVLTLGGLNGATKAIGTFGGYVIKDMSGKHPRTQGLVGLGALHVQNTDLGLPILAGAIFCIMRPRAALATPFLCSSLLVAISTRASVLDVSV